MLLKLVICSKTKEIAIPMCCFFHYCCEWTLPWIDRMNLKSMVTRDLQVVRQDKHKKNFSRPKRPGACVMANAVNMM